jgi:hypothetical protein
MAQDYYALHWPYPITALAAGNCGDNCTTDCSTVSHVVANKSYNALIVGGSDDHTTDATSDDTMAVFSPYGNPTTTHGDFELPNLVAPAIGIDSASITNFCGTSGATPQVLGTALLMKARDTSFADWPEMTRASILATAVAGVDNATRTTRLGGGVGDIKQGAGLLNSNRAVILADPANHRAPNSTGAEEGRNAQYYSFSTDFTSNVSNDAYYINVSHTGRLRAAMAWDGTPSGCSTVDGSGCAGEVLDGDLDLHLDQWTGSSWTNVCSSTTYDSSWETCDIAVTNGDAYRIQFVKYATPAAGTYIGVAWYTYDPAND